MKLFSNWQFVTTKTIHTLKNRFRITGAASGNGTYDPVDGAVNNVSGIQGWDLIAEYQENGESTWNPSKMKLLSRVQNGAELKYVIGAEDPRPAEDYEDIQWDAVFKGRMFDIPYRPYAVRINDLFQMPDGIFDTILGSYYMGIRITNVYAEAFTASHTLDISNHSRSELSAQGITIIDTWTSQELNRLSQEQIGRGISLNGLQPGESKTIYFKISVGGAAPKKYNIEFIHIDIDGTPDPKNQKRLLNKQFFVSSSYVDSANGELVCSVAEGTVRMKLKEVGYDKKGASKSRKKCKCPTSKNQESLEDLRKKLMELLDGKKIDACEINKLLEGTLGPDWEKCCDPIELKAGKYCVKPFFAFPIKYEVTIEPSTAFIGQYGPIPFNDPWWKVLLLIVAAILFLAGVLTEAADIAYHDEDLVIGTLDRFQGNDIDGALCRLDTSRALNLREMIDAKSDEPHTVFVTTLDGVISLNGPVMSRTEIEAFLATGDTNNLRVFKSGGRTGLTFGIITGSNSFGHPEVTWGIGQLRIEVDDDPSFGNGMEVSNSGDSGSCWIHQASLRPVGLNHSGNIDGDEFAVASFLEDVQSILNVTF
ncbi:hypothetical protein [Aurantibacter sp.]|uniref:hypothetical protein n=1 Tax=Aurantibacter sp. TaxID=2807103 RepID=UPI003266C910